MKPHKYHAVATDVDGHRFASKAEARRYVELKLLEKAGEIYNLYCQPVYDLHVVDLSVGGNLKRAAAWLGKKPPADTPRKIGRYVGDFSYWTTKDDTHVVEDVKGFKTPLYRWKRKHVEAQYGIEITEVK